MREKWIDNAKGIAMIMVLMGHLFAWCNGILSFDFVFGIHMVMFFLISGYTSKEGSLTSEYISKKFAKLMNPYFLTCFFILLLSLLKHCISEKNFSLSYISSITWSELVRFFYASGYYTQFGTVDTYSCIGALWFFPALFFSFIFFQLSTILIKRNAYRGFILFLLAVLSFVIKNFIWLPFSIWSGLFASFFLWLGYTTKQTNIISKLKLPHYLITLAVVIVGYFFGFCQLHFVSVYMPDIILSSIIGICGCVVIVGLSKLDSKGVVLSYVGKNTSLILCSHLFFMEGWDVLMYLFGKTGLAINTYYLIVSILCFILSFIPLLIWEFAKKIRLSWSQKSLSCSQDFSNYPTIYFTVICFSFGLIICQFNINSDLRTLLCSCSAAGIVFFSGFLYQRGTGFIKHLILTVSSILLPYIFAILIRVFSPGHTLKIEFTGLISLIICLFIDNLIYFLIDHTIKKRALQIVILSVLSIAGYALNKMELRLPVSIDVYFFSVSFFTLGVCASNYKLLDTIKTNKYLYFLLSPIWAFFIYIGGCDILSGYFSNFGYTLIGATAGILTVYIFSEYITSKIPLPKTFAFIKNNSQKNRGNRI